MPGENTNSFANQLRQYRLQRGLTQEGLAERANLSPRAIVALEKGERKAAHRDTVRLLVEALGLTQENYERLEIAAASQRKRQPRQQRLHYSPHHNLPTPLSSFIGRQWEIQEVRRLLGETRLLTLTGPGGCGKTRLVLQAAEAVLDDFEDGVFFVGLSPIVDPALVIPAISQVLSLREAVDEPPIEALKAYLRDRRVLLLLDNFEQVVDAAPLLVELLMVAPRVKTLVTSRTRLHVSGEHELPVPPLAPPDTGSTFEELRANPAVSLFAERARAAKPDFVLTAENVPLVAEICARLDGLPLAIELAAARTRRFMLQAIQKRFPSRLDLGSDGPCDAPWRQQTLRCTISWSHDLLRPDEQRLFRRLAVFSGACPEDAAMEVYNLSGDEALHVDGLDSLIENNLLRQTSGVNDERRFEMLETIREYALECLESSGEQGAALSAHADYFLRLAETADPEFDGPRQTYWLDRLELEHDNFRAVLRWCKEQGEIVTGLRLSTSLMSLWQLRDHQVEGRRWLETFMTDDCEVPPGLRAKALVWQGLLLLRYSGEFTGAEPLFDRALALYREIDDLSKACETLQAQGDLALKQGDVPTALDRFTQSLDVAQQAGDNYLAARAYMKMASGAQEDEDYDTAQHYWEGALETAREAGHEVSIALALTGLGEVARYKRDLERAQCYYQQSLELGQRIDSEWCIAMSLHNLGYIACYRVDHERAIGLFSKSLSLHEKRQTKKGIAECLAGLAYTATSQRQVERSARLCGAAEALLGSIGTRLDPLERAEYEQTLGILRSKLTDERFEALVAEGGAMSLEQAIEYARNH